MSRTTQEEKKTITVDEYFKTIKESVTTDFLKKGIERCVQPGSSTAEQLKDNGIQACVVNYLSNQDLMCVNPASWARTEYHISDVYEESGIKYKIYVGIKD